MGALLEWVLGEVQYYLLQDLQPYLGVRGALPVLLQSLLGLGKVAILVAIVKVAVLSTAVVKVAPVLEGVIVKVAVFPKVVVVNLVTGLVEA